MSPALEPKSSLKIAYRPDVDGLRAFAVLSVVLFHFAPETLRGGFVGVDVFFVISGFLISSIIYEDLERGRFSIAEFYVRRIRRIYPALFAVLAAVGLAGCVLLLPLELVALGKQMIGGATFSANIVLWAQSGYFAPAAALKPLLHLWSLGVEEQFYLFFPLLCALCYNSRRRWELATVFALIAVASFALNVGMVQRHGSAVFFLPFARLWELFCGAGLSLLQRRRGKNEAGVVSHWLGTQVLGWTGLALLVVSVTWINESMSFPGWPAVLPVLGSAMTIAAGPRSWPNRILLSNRVAVFVGLISYPLYLWHWPVLSFLRITAATWGVTLPGGGKLGLAFSFVASWATYRFLELPIRGVRDASQRRRGALQWLAAVAAMGMVGAVLIAGRGFAFRLSPRMEALDHDYEADAVREWRTGTCFLEDNQDARAFTPDCVEAGTGPLVAIWGDSHAADLVPGLRTQLQARGERLAQFTASLCQPILGLDVANHPNCRAVNAEVAARMKQLRPNVVVLSGFWEYPGRTIGRAALASRLADTVRDLKSHGVGRVVVVGSAPVWPNNVFPTLIGALRRNPRAGVPQRLDHKLLQPLDDSQLEAAVAAAGAEFVAIEPVVCDAASCQVATGQGWQDLLVYDTAHFTPQGSEWLMARIGSQILH